MRTLITFLAAMMLATMVKAQLPSTSLYEHFVLSINPNKPDSAYGRMPERPILLGGNKYLANPEEGRKLMTRFGRTYTWPDGSPVEFSKPTTVFLSGTNVDKYVLHKAGSHDSLVIYVDMFNEGLVGVPDGLSLYSKAQLGKDLKPVIDTINTLFTAKDPYKDAAIQQKSFMLVSFLQNSVGLNYLMDQNQIGALIADNTADGDLKAYLIRSYIFHKFVFDATGQENAGNKAFNAVAAEYVNVLKLHPDLKKGQLDNLLHTKS